MRQEQSEPPEPFRRGRSALVPAGLGSNSLAPECPGDESGFCRDEANLLARLAEQQGRLVSELLARAARADRASQENDRLARQLEDSTTHLQEIHHRVRNHLQGLIGWLSAQELTEASPAARPALRKSIARLASIAAIHDLLAQEAGSDQFHLPEIARRLAQQLLCQAGADERLQVETQVAAIKLSERQATSFVLILTELLSNAIEHGFAGGGKGKIAVRAGCDRGHAFLEVHDSGAGLPAGFDPTQGHSLGLQLVERLAASDLGGSVRAWNAEGACFRVAFPLSDVGKE